MTTLHLRKSIGRSPLRHGFLLIPLLLVCFGLSQTVRAQLSPAPDGGYANENTAEGDDALFNLQTNGVRNTAVGFDALFSNTGGGANTAIGAAALASNSANDNTACGSYALANNTTGSGNTATGIDALMLNIDGSGNTANGRDALFNNTSGSGNTANGNDALFSNTTGTNNTANGLNALISNTTGANNTASGVNALSSNTTGNNNTANGANALSKSTTGTNNTANGVGALARNTIGFQNTASGVNALYHTTGSNNTANGDNALLNNTSGTGNIALGASAGLTLTTGSNNIDIGNVGVAGESSRIRIGHAGTQTATFIAGISGTAVTGTGVVVNSSGQLGVAPSSERFKDNIKPMDKASEAILALKPVTFRYKHDVDPMAIPQFGLVAEEVEKVNPALVTRDAKGDVYTVRYEAVNAMLLNEFLKEYRQVQTLKSTAAKQEATITELKKDLRITVAELTARLKEQDSKIEKVSAQVEVSKAAPQMISSSQ